MKILVCPCNCRRAHVIKDCIIKTFVQQGRVKTAQAHIHPGTDIQRGKPHPEATSLEEVCAFKK